MVEQIHLVSPGIKHILCHLSCIWFDWKGRKKGEEIPQETDVRGMRVTRDGEIAEHFFHLKRVGYIIMGSGFKAYGLCIRIL